MQLGQPTKPQTSLRFIARGHQIGGRLKQCLPLLFACPPIFLRSSTGKHAPFVTLALCRTRTESPIQLSIFPGLPRSSCACICRAFFRHFSVSSLNEPWPRCNSSNVLNGLIIGLGYHWTDVSAACDGFLSTRARALDNK